MILGFLLLFTNFVACLCYEYYMEYNPLWTGPGDALGNQPFKLFYKENNTAVPVDLVQKDNETVE